MDFIKRCMKMQTAFLITIIMLCVVLIMALLSTKTVEYITYSYSTDGLALDHNGCIRIRVFHDGVKDCSFLVNWDRLNPNAQDALRRNAAICLVCSENPLFEEARVKQIWYKEGYAKVRII